MPDSSANATSANATENPQVSEVFPASVKKSFLLWVKDRNNKTIFDSNKRTRYRWILEVPDAPIYGTKEEKAVKFNERHDALTHFMLKDNQLYRKANKTGQSDRRVAFDYDAADIIERIHSEIEHAGNSKTFRRINEMYYGISKAMMEWLLKRCAVCLNHRKNNIKTPLQPIIATKVLERVQVDLMNMKSDPNGIMKWICHMKCHFSKFSSLYAMPNKEASSVAKCFESYVSHLGISDIVQCDNGKEFKGAVLILLKNQGIKVINGRPRTPRTQGLVEQANGVLKDKIKRRIEATGNPHWAQHLARIALAMNTQGHDSLPYKMTPYEVFFGRKYPHRPNSYVTAIEQQSLNKLADDVIDKFCVQGISDPAVENAFENHLELEPEDEAHDEDEENEHLSSINQQSLENPGEMEVRNNDNQETGNVEEEEEVKEEERIERVEEEEGIEQQANARNKKVLLKQANRRNKMKERYNSTHNIHTFKVGDIVTVAIPAKDRAVNDAPRMETQIVSIPHENRFKLRTEYGVLANHYPTSELNPVPSELLEPLMQKLAGPGPRTLTLTLHAAAALRSTSTDLPVKCDCKSKCNTRRCNCFKNKTKCTQYCHSGHGDCDNLPDTIAQQTGISMIPRTKRKRQSLIPSSKEAKKKPMVDRTEPSLRAHGLQSDDVFLSTRSRTRDRNWDELGNGEGGDGGGEKVGDGEGDGV